MNKKRIACILASLMLLSNATSFAEIPKGTVVINNKAYSLVYANEEKNLQEIMKEYNSASNIYIKDFDGKWYRNLNEKNIDEKMIPEVIYTGKDGKVREFKAGDGEEIFLEVEMISFISENQIQIDFSDEMNKTSVEDKGNYRVGNKALDENDMVALAENGRSVILTLAKKIDVGVVRTNISISNKILDKNNKSMSSEINKDLLVINDENSKIDKSIEQDVIILTDNFELKNIEVKGNVVALGKNIVLDNIQVEGKLYVIGDKAENLTIRNSTLNELSVKDGNVDIKDSKVDLLTCYGEKQSEISAGSRTKISKSFILGNTKIKSNYGEFGDIIANFGESNILSLDGEVNETVSVISSGIVQIEKGGKAKKISLSPITQSKKVKIIGEVQDVEVLKDTQVVIDDNCKITGKLVVKSSADVQASKRNNIKKIVFDAMKSEEELVLKGIFGRVEVVNKSNVRFEEDTKLDTMVVYNNVKLFGGSSSQIKEVQKNKETDIDIMNKGLKVDKIVGINDGNDYTYIPPVINYKPVASNVIVEGVFTEGESIQGKYEYSDKEGDREKESVYEWFVADSAEGTNKQKIIGADKIKLVIVEEYVGKYVAFKVTPKAAAGNTTGNSVTSDFYGPVLEIDDEKPVITLNGYSHIEILKGDNYHESGATALDNRDGDITSKIVTQIIGPDGNVVNTVDTNVVGTYTIKYNVQDEAGNSALEVTRQVTVKEVAEDVNVIINIDEFDVSIRVFGSSVSNQASVRITEKESGKLKFLGTEVADDNEALFNIRIETEGTYVAEIRPYTGGDMITREFEIKRNQVDEDTIKPELSLNGESRVEVEKGQEYSDAGATAIDNKDGDLTSEIIVKITNPQGNVVYSVDTNVIGTYTIKYNVSDAAGNAADEVQRQVVVKEVADTEKPQVELMGKKVITLELGESFNDPGVVATDDKDGDLSSAVVKEFISQKGEITNEINTSIEGEYLVRYTAVDSAGNSDYVERYVVVKESEQSETVKIDIDGYNVKVSVVSDEIEENVTLKIINVSTGEIEDIQSAASEGNKVVFRRRIEKTGEFKVEVNGAGTEKIVRNFTLEQEDINTVKPIMTLIGQRHMIVKIGQEYQEAGVNAVDNKDGNITDQVQKIIIDSEGNQVEEVSTSAPGIYEIYYVCSDSDGNRADILRRNVEVKAPVQQGNIDVSVNGYNVSINVTGEGMKKSVSMKIINLDTEQIIDVQEKQPVNNQVDFDRVIEKAGRYRVVVNAFDNGEALQEEFVIQEQVPVDEVKPVITLIGNPEIELEVGMQYIDNGAEASDNVDGNITDSIVTTIKNGTGDVVDSVDTSKVGEYTVCYNVQDNAGNSADEVTRRVTIKEKHVSPVTVEVDGYNVKVSVSGENMKSSVTMKIINNETGIIEDVQTKQSSNNYVEFFRRIEKSGSFSVEVNAFDDQKITETFQIIGEGDQDTVKPVLTLVGAEEVEIRIGDSYEELGARAVDNKDGDITERVEITIKNSNGEVVSEIDTSNTGEYTIHYNVEDNAGNKADSLERRVSVKERETVIPVEVVVDGYNVKISISGDNMNEYVTMKIINNETEAIEDIQTQKSNNGYIEFNRRIEKKGLFTVELNAFENTNSTAVFEIIGEPVVDTEKPVITLNGSDVIDLYVGDAYVEHGATALDNVDGDISSRVSVEIKDSNNTTVGSINTSEVGEYSVIYSVQDTAGNIAESVVRTVRINEKVVNPVQVEVDGYNVKVTVTGSNMKDNVTMKIYNNSTGAVEDAQTKQSSNNSVVFTRRIEKAGYFTVEVNAFGNTNNTATFEIVGEDNNNDTVKPVITLKGAENMELFVGDNYVEKGVTAVDNKDGDISSKVAITMFDENHNSVDSINTEAPGKYYVHYNVQDNAGNAADEIIRTVTVSESQNNGTVDISVDGLEVTITVTGENMKSSVTMMIMDKETGAVVDVQDKASSNNTVQFVRMLRKAGTYQVTIKAFRNSAKIVSEFTID